MLLPFAAALALRLGLTLAVPVRPVWDGAIYTESADAIAQGIGYVRGSMDRLHPTRPTAFYPVGFPAILAVLRLLRVGSAFDLVAQAFAGAFAALGAGLLGRRAGGRTAGVRAAWLVALWPGGILLSASWMAESFFALFVVAASLVVAYAPRRRALEASVGAALILGLGAYVRPTALPMALALACGLALASTTSASGRARALALHLGSAAAVLAFTIAPWAMRNHAALGALVPISTNGGANLLIGTRGHGGFAPLPDPADLGCARMAEVALDRCLGRLALERIADDPLSWLARGLLKMTHTFGHESSPAQGWARATAEAGLTGEAHGLWALAIDRAFWLPFLTAAIAGGAILARRGHDAHVKVAVFAPLLALAALHFVYLGGDRYHAPVVPSMAVLASLAIGAFRGMPLGGRAGG